MKTVILDGSNIIRTMYNTSFGINYEVEKILTDSLIRTVESLNGSTDPLRIEIYFDGPKREVYRPAEFVEIFFSKLKKADQLIVNATESLEEMGYQNVLVVTQDKDLGEECQYYGAEVMSAKDFLRRCQDFMEGFARA